MELGDIRNKAKRRKNKSEHSIRRKAKNCSEESEEKERRIRAHCPEKAKRRNREKEGVKYNKEHRGELKKNTKVNTVGVLCLWENKEM
jgi:hypothetical protein